MSATTAMARAGQPWSTNRLFGLFGGHFNQQLPGGPLPWLALDYVALRPRFPRVKPQHPAFFSQILMLAVLKRPKDNWLRHDLSEMAGFASTRILGGDARSPTATWRPYNRKTLAISSSMLR
jgi:hypothetical protein